ncbi:MAG: hypothetical protein ACE5LB_03585 [Acidiferrobacterales bacterium]
MADQQKLVHYAVFVTPIYQGKAELDNGGEFSVSRLFTEFDVTMPLSRKVIMTLAFGYDIENYNFSDIPGFAGVKPWDDIRRFGFRPQFFFRGKKRWNYIFTPIVQWVGETNADSDESLIYGATFGATYTFSRKLTIGPAVGAFSRLEKTTIFPFLFINWKINERLTLRNPFRAGPAGTAGLELVYTPNEKWEIAGGGAVRSFRFRLDDEGPVPNGIGESSGLPLFARVTRKFGPQFKLDVYAGAFLEGQLDVENSDGDLLAADTYDPAPLVAVTFGGRF